MTPAATGLEVGVPVATLWSSPDAPRDLDAPALWDRPDPLAWTARLDAAGAPDGRVGLVGRTLTQALLGEPVQARSERGNWVEVRLPWQGSSLDPAGYAGWMRRSHLARPAPRSDGATPIVVQRAADLRVDGEPAVRVSLGTVLWPDGVSAGEHVVLLPGGRRGRLSAQVVGPATRTGARGITPGLLLRTARSFLGLRYLWGGLSSRGVDCSGLVHLTLRSLGRRVPRDAHDQQAAVPTVVPVPAGEARPGDLYFFGAGRVTHVGLVSDRSAPDGRPLMLHAPERDGGGLVEEAPLDRQRRASLLGAGRLGFLVDP